MPRKKGKEIVSHDLPPALPCQGREKQGHLERGRTQSVRVERPLLPAGEKYNWCFIT
ncbi:MAG: hypothetical protein K8R40_09095 [Anaerolineaceae bacterium]|nr:hypothetical protein [Anaerolineaceae bacterium]